MFVIKKKEIKKAIYIKKHYYSKKNRIILFLRLYKCVEYMLLQTTCQKVDCSCCMLTAESIDILNSGTCLLFSIYLFVFGICWTSKVITLSDLPRIKKQADCVNCFWKNYQPFHEKNKKDHPKLEVLRSSWLQNYPFIS